MHDQQSLPALDQLAFGGERVTHLYPNDCYFAHLSLYHFALPYTQGGIVLDAGSGSGYGANFLAEHGAAQVHGVDSSAVAVRYCQATFSRPNLEFSCGDLRQIDGFPERYFDVIFSSNTLEHVDGVAEFLRSAYALLKVDGVLIAALPPVVGEDSRSVNLSNPYHVNIWTPRQWHEVFGLYFKDVKVYRHHFAKPGITLDFDNAPEQTKITERDFEFDRCSLSALYELPTLTAVFVVQGHRPAEQLPAACAPLPLVENSFTRPAPHPGPEATVSTAGAWSAARLRSLCHKSFHALRKGGPRQLLNEAYRSWSWHAHWRRSRSSR